MKHTPQFPTFPLDSLEPYFDAATMDIHTHKHHQTYADKLNAILASPELITEAGPNLQTKTLNELLTLDNQALSIMHQPLKVSQLKNFAGGVYNHNFFWSILTPSFDQPVPEPLKTAIDNNFASFDNFKAEFTTKASTLFGSGWTWLVAAKSASPTVEMHNYAPLQIINLPNQDTPLFTHNPQPPQRGPFGVARSQVIPLLCLDLWEHSYYLKYQNRRPEYIENFFHLIDWQQVNELYQKTLSASSK